MSTEQAYVIIVNQHDDVLHRGHAVLWKLTVPEAQAVCSDPRTRGPQHFLAWIRETDCRHLRQVHDDGRYAEVLADLGIVLEAT